MAQNNQNQNKAQNQNKPQGQQTQEAAEKEAAEAKLKSEQEAAEKEAAEAKAEKLPVDSVKYAKFCDLKFAQLGEAKLKDEQLKELAELEAELKGCTGAIAKRTVRAAIKNEHALMVAGIPVTKAIEELVNTEGSEAYYFV